MVNSPEITVITSTDEVPNSYSPAAITPTVAVPSAESMPIETTLPSKYWFVLNILFFIYLIVNFYLRCKINKKTPQFNALFSNLHAAVFL
jgi:hypothetical protein